TLNNSIIKILDRLGLRKNIIVSSAPQLRYPNCYGIYMAKINDFIAFKAAISLIKEQGKEQILNDVYKLCKNQENKLEEEPVNHVKKIYDLFSYHEISKRIGQLLKPEGINAEVEIIYQTIENLHHA